MSRRIALISEHASPLGALGGADAGGQNVYVAHVARRLAAAGYEVDIFTRRDSAHLDAVVDVEPGVRVVHVPAGPAEFIAKEQLLPHMAAFADWMERFCSTEQRYDLVHANFWMSGLVALRLKEALGLPFVVTFHALGRIRRRYQGEADGFPNERFAIEDAVVAAADRVIAECPQDQEDLINLYNADPARLAVVPCGFAPDEFGPISKELARVSLGLAPDERIVVQVGRMVPRKGVDNAIRGFARLLRDHGVAARMLIVGGESDDPDPALTPEIGRLQQIARDEGVEQAVIFTGRRDHDALRYYYGAADVFVTTPWYEPFGITPVEAMACGTPVVGANVGGIKFSVRDGETGYLVPPDNPGALAERLAHLYRYPRLRLLLGQQAVERVNALFTWDGVAASLAALYEDVLASVHGEADTAKQLLCADKAFDGAVNAIRLAQRQLRAAIPDAVETMTRTMLRGGKLLLCGNGGSAADAQHLAAEFVGRYKREGRAGLPALALSTDGAVLTAWANDACFEDVFARQVGALGREGDVLLGFSTSGRSRNVVAAFHEARRLGLRTIAVLGGDGGELRALADVALVVPSSDTQRIQEVHGILVHVLAELVEERVLAGRSARLLAAAALPQIRLHHADLPASVALGRVRQA
jgi:D-inositol-3-phosphate glycosyltransferase